MRCFFCLKEKEPSLEHVFPEAIGGTLTTDRLCRVCNSTLGSEVDVRLTDHPAILVKRQECGMATSAGKPVDAFRSLLYQGTLATDPEKRIQLVADPTTGVVTPKMMYHARRTETEDGATSVQITLDESDIEQVRTVVQRERRRAGMDPMPESEISRSLRKNPPEHTYARTTAGQIRRKGRYFSLSEGCLQNYLRACLHLAWRQLPRRPGRTAVSRHRFTRQGRSNRRTHPTRWQRAAA